MSFIDGLKSNHVNFDKAKNKQLKNFWFKIMNNKHEELVVNILNIYEITNITNNVSIQLMMCQQYNIKRAPNTMYTLNQKIDIVNFWINLINVYPLIQALYCLNHKELLSKV